MSIAAQSLAFISPHAVQRFRERIDPSLTYEQALAAILQGLREPDAVVHRRLRDGTSVANVRCRGQRYQFRAVLAPAPEPGLLPVCITVLQATKGRLYPGTVKR